MTLLAFRPLARRCWRRRHKQAPSGDWPQWRGPDRNGISKETGLLKQWPTGDPPRLWTRFEPRHRLRLAGRSWANGSLFRCGRTSECCCESQSREWTDRVVEAARELREQRKGTRAAGYANDRRGPFVRLERDGRPRLSSVADGAIVWQRNILSDFKGFNIQWLISESPLVDGNSVIVSPGGRNADGRSRQDDGQDGLDQQRAQRRGRLFLRDRRRRGGCPDLMTFTGNTVSAFEPRTESPCGSTQAANRTANIATRSFTTTRCFSRRHTAPAARCSA